jgi:hypothetical protein
MTGGGIALHETGHVLGAWRLSRVPVLLPPARRRRMNDDERACRLCNP